jgi:hypothetical protein
MLVVLREHVRTAEAGEPELTFETETMIDTALVPA